MRGPGRVSPTTPMKKEICTDTSSFQNKDPSPSSMAGQHLFFFFRSSRIKFTSTLVYHHEGSVSHPSHHAQKKTCFFPFTPFRIKTSTLPLLFRRKRLTSVRKGNFADYLSQGFWLHRFLQDMTNPGFLKTRVQFIRNEGSHQNETVIPFF
jgi:hypothetical protein